jgi:starvation-inducible DNA-binding protein
MATAALVVPNLGFKQEHVDAICDLLNKLLADEHVLYMRLRNYHWNVVGPRFPSLHKLFEEQYEQIAEEIDAIAERVRVLGSRAIGTMTEMLPISRLREIPTARPKDDVMCMRLVEDHETIIRHLRDSVAACTQHFHDEDTADLLIRLMRMHGKMAWMLRSTLESTETFEA